MDNLQAVKHLETFIPSSYIKGQWFAATMINGRPCEVRASKPGYLMVRVSTIFNTKTPSGEIISKNKGYLHFTCNRMTGQIKETQPTIGEAVQ